MLLTVFQSLYFLDIIIENVKKFRNKIFIENFLA